jgi:uncharacterized membrane protein HdeD (DUF308 family)
MTERVTHLGRGPGPLLVFGVVSLIAGILALVWPHETLLFLAILFGAQLVVGGIFWFIRALSTPDQSAWARAMLAVLSVLSFVAGIYLLRHPVFTVLILAVLLGLYWIAHGVVELFAAIGRRDLPARGLTVVNGVLGIVAGGILLFLPNTSLLVLALVLGIWLIVFGIIAIATAAQIRAGPRSAPASRPSPSAG